ncbi:putative bifunctional diguanylate cyclase/phosphodiesterase [Alteromonas oceanisediminis]|uniref:putative bifunctional diguanylate cyclase/phosphodiesterase n=1 Tax=Alteromonas oceanisediminis TaxID=2836180 RepID=UPI001BD9E922|nr:GGDEF domain-containing response regulator [Alteromonas oceanisediminis]MBT0587302.1 EAL domain-containing protein [Alteromonas oceanisediminis]
MQILIVDDDRADRKIIRRLLDEQPGSIEVVEAESVGEGLEVLAKKQFDVVLLDYKMPRANGIEMVIELRSRPNLGDAAIVMMSAAEENDLALSCIEAGAQDFLAKSEISHSKLSKAILHAKKRFEIERKMHASYIAVKNMAEKDSLTGLSNRYHFEETLKVMLANNKRSQHSVALIAMDIDNFKHVNDSLGHEAGDILLQKVVSRINALLRSNEGFARLGGDEFAIILGAITGVGQVSNIANRILTAMEAPFAVGEHTFICSLSIGAALYPADACTSEELMKYADIAMYRAKQSGKNKVCFYEKAFQVEFNRRFTIQTQLNKVLSENRFSLHYQPIFDHNKEQPVSFEALIRWPRDTDDYFTPDEFIPVAEETRVINQIGNWIVTTALTQLSQWQQHNEALSMSINISPVQLMHSDLVGYLKREISRLDLKPGAVTLEVTETALFEDDKKIRVALNDLANFGCRIALDDFGMGFSSISHLMQYPIHTVKLDKSMQTSHRTNDRVPIFEAIALMVQKLGFVVIAEGIETQEQLELCKLLGIDRVQGYYTGKPTPQKEAGLLVTKSQ